MRLYFFWMILVSLVVFFIQREHQLYSGHSKMCDIIKDNFVERLTDFELEECKNLYFKAHSLKHWELVTNSWLGTWGWSHLAVYSPAETSEIWESKTENIGVKLKKIDGVFIVYRAHPDSDFKKGDLIIKVNGLNPENSSVILSSGGTYTVERQGEVITLKTRVKDYSWHDHVRAEKNKIVVPSFRGEFFTDSELEKISDFIKKSDSDEIYIDLRDNLGGNIAAALKFMSIFFCEEQVIGTFKIPSREGLGQSTYPQDISQAVQIEHLKRFYKVDLKVPTFHSCTSKPLIVLVNSLTSSTAELFAQAIKDLNRGRVVGEVTSGRMVLSSWDQIPNFPEDYYFSYPYALYYSVSGSEIEREGVEPDVFKTYDLSIEKQGLDSFLTSQ